MHSGGKTTQSDILVPQVEDNVDGTATIKYNSRNRGSHELTLLYNEKPVQGKQTLRFIAYLI